MTRTDEPASRAAALWSVLANWRDWNLPVKLAAVTLVPVIFAIVLGAMQIADQVDQAASYRRVDRLVKVNEELRKLVVALQKERADGVVLLAARATDVAPELAPEQRATDRARDGFTRAAQRVTLDEQITHASYGEVRRWLGELPVIRKQVTGSLIDASTALGRYTDVVDALLRFDRTLSTESIDPRLAATSSALYELEVIREQVAFQHALIGAGIVRGGLVGPDLDALRTSAGRLADSTTDFYAVAGDDRGREYDASVSGTGVASRNNIVGVVLATRPGTDIPTTAQDWNDVSALTTGRIGEVATVLGEQLRTRSAALQDEASDGAGLAAVILLVALVVAIAVMFVVGRHLLGSLSALRRSALDVAERRLPDAVARIRDRGDQAGDADPIAVEPVPVTSMDEVGQVARAFDAVQQQALRLATEQAGLRAKYSSVFVNLSRRSQGLVQRQLQLLERLERDEEDADQLATLFQLDHLATRMRRNNENLMVLSGSDVGRRNQRPASLADLLSAGVSEIEQYQRVVMLPPPSVQIVGYAVGDLVRLTAELLDNATAFSAPDTQVTIASHSFEDASLCIAVLDEGIGMSQAELDEANGKLADSGAIDVSTSRRMGLFVIGRLAGRHGIEVRLGGGHDVPGVRATVTVPAELVSAPSADPPTATTRAVAPATPSSGLVPFAPNGTPVNGHTNGRTNGAVNGTTNGSTNGTNGSNGSAQGSGDARPSPLPRRARPVNGTDITRRLGGDVGGEVGGVEEPRPPAPAPEPAPVESTPDLTPAEQAEPAEPAESATPKNEKDDERGALPRRSPGTRMPGPAVPNGPAGPPGPPGITRPRAPFTPPDREVSPADGLFTPAGRDDRDGGWWTPRGPGRPVDRAAIEETTPIFDEMVSAWFRTVTDRPAPPRPAGRPPRPPEPRPEPRRRQDDQWRFAADSGFDAARAVSRAAPAAYTDNGLPRRSAGQNLVPGSAGDPASAAPRHGRAAEDMRDRLSNYRHGVQRARDHRQDEPRRDADPGRLDLSGAGWRFAADVGWRAANSVSTSTPVDFTSGGLPRRSAGEHLMPGSVAPSGGGPLRMDRAEEMRGRLGSFQKGLSRGRRSLAERGTGNGFPENKQQESE
ncbi:MAG: HAMP domain-containing protein [Actinophytocola sp.]|uniref:sensor histidine kinase n=1 Tax=Actinophytocola sp. TaxID=1872138 RepID=UPI00132C2B10|nr:nitrate- and nitrite sensing domain-containing protein [Actinophytocola sp.]MPZ80945.1 HAMP domain-containing protein [Actinophytocola sp.]